MSPSSSQTPETEHPPILKRSVQYDIVTKPAFELDTQPNTLIDGIDIPVKDQAVALKRWVKDNKARKYSLMNPPPQYTARRRTPLLESADSQPVDVTTQQEWCEDIMNLDIFEGRNFAVVEAGSIKGRERHNPDQNYNPYSAHLRITVTHHRQTHGDDHNYSIPGHVDGVHLRQQVFIGSKPASKTP